MAAAPESSASDSIYAQVDNYPWDTDAEFQSGLGAILGSTASSEQAVELSLRARCFYYSRYASLPNIHLSPHYTPPLELAIVLVVLGPAFHDAPASSPIPRLLL